MGKTNDIILSGIVSAVTSVIIVLLTWLFNISVKNKEFKLTNYRKEQIEVIKNIYQLVVNLNFANNLLFRSNNRILNKSDYINNLLKWQKSFNSLYEYYHLNKIFFIHKPKMNEEIRDSLNQLGLMWTEISKEANALNEYSEYIFNEYEINSVEEEHELIVKRLMQVQNSLETKKLVNLFEKIRKDIENYFGTLI